MANTTSKKPKTGEPAKPPVAKLRIGLINASIWQRTTDKGNFHSVSFERRYKDAAGNWQTTHSFDASDLLALAKLADQAHTNLSDFVRRKALEAAENSFRPSCAMFVAAHDVHHQRGNQGSREEIGCQHRKANRFRQRHEEESRHPGQEEHRHEHNAD